MTSASGFVVVISESRSWVDADRAALWLVDWAAGRAVKKSDDTIRCRRSASLFTADSMDSIRITPKVQSVAGVKCQS